MSDIIANFSHYIIPNYDIGDSEALERMLSVWDARRYTLIPIGYYYNEETKELRIPRGFNYYDLKRKTGRNITVNFKPQEFDKIDIRLYQAPRDELQLRMISFLCGLGKYKNTEKYSQLFCDLDTGKGKTYCTIATISHYKTKAAIFIPGRLSKLISQWKESIIKYTNKKERDILVVQGSEVCEAILEGEYEDKEFFIFSNATVVSFAKTHGWNKFQELMEKIRVGVKVIDEAHMELRTIVMIDCHSNVKRNIYLTSSAGRGDIYEDKIFKRIFDTVPIMGKNLSSQDDNYITMIIFQFSHKPTTKQRLDCKTKEGLSAAKYSSYLVDKTGARYEFFTALDKALKTVFVKVRNEGLNVLPNITTGEYKRNENGYIKVIKKDNFKGKLLILGATREFLRTIQKFLEVNYPQYSIGMYTGDIDPKIRKNELEKDIILATNKGLGTGADIKDLQFVINLIPYSNKIDADQIPGRLRNNGRKVFYMEIVNIAFDEAAAQYRRRSKYLSLKAKDGKLIQIQI